jgi:thioredoxin reductase
MNYQFDIIIIGDSKQGNDALKKLANASKAIKIAFVSRTFKSKTTHDFLNVEYIKSEVTLLDYKNRLFGCYLKNGDRLYSTHMIIATGLQYAPLIINNKQVPNVFNTTDDLDKLTKSQQAVVIGSCNADVKFATAIAKKYKYVYFCTKSLTPDISDSNMNKLTNIENLVVLPNTSISKFTVKDNMLSSLELDNYSTLTCSAIFIKTESIPETTFIPNKIIEKDAEGYLVTSENLESVLVPKIFAVGNCVRKSTKKMNLAMIETILNDFGGIK